MPSTRISKLVGLLFIFAVLFSIGLWLTDDPQSVSLQYEVSVFSQFAFFETTWLYLYLHLFTLLPILLLSFDRRVQFYKSWKHLFPAISVVAVLFIIWDIVFTQMGIWGFNSRYHLPLHIAGLPLEEWLFFFSVPFACVFIYECLNYYVKTDWLAPFDRLLSIGSAMALLIAGIYFIDQLYTATTFLIAGSFLLFHYCSFKNTFRTRFFLAYLVSWIPFLLVDGVLTGGFTSEPVVLYHPEEFIGWRIGSVPFEDSIYSLLMLLGVITLLEKFRKRLVKKN